MKKPQTKKRTLAQRFRQAWDGWRGATPRSDSLEADNASLESQVKDLSKSHSEMAAFGQLAGMMQVCANLEELCKISMAAARDLFPAESGGLYLFQKEGAELNRRGTWGDQLSKTASELKPEDCWGFRTGNPHYMETSPDGLLCGHVSKPAPRFVYCLPLVGPEGTLGLLHLRAGAAEATLPKERQLVAVALAHQIALGLSNLKLKTLLKEDALRDELTGLFNRRYLAEAIEREISRAQRRKKTLGILAIDLDHFKLVNDRFGHSAGDKLLRSVASLLKERLRAEDIVCRQGGDEFLAVLPEISSDSALALAQGLRKSAVELIGQVLPSMKPSVTLSMGIALFPADARTSEELLKKADRAMYRSKGLGRDQIFLARNLKPEPAKSKTNLIGDRQ